MFNVRLSKSLDSLENREVVCKALLMIINSLQKVYLGKKITFAPLILNY
jgi:hypothetical protein